VPLPDAPFGITKIHSPVESGRNAQCGRSGDFATVALRVRSMKIECQDSLRDENPAQITDRRRWMEFAKVGRDRSRRMALRRLSESRHTARWGMKSRLRIVWVPIGVDAVAGSRRQGQSMKPTSQKWTSQTNVRCPEPTPSYRIGPAGRRPRMADAIAFP
jgi:hypothetical protein